MYSQEDFNACASRIRAELLRMGMVAVPLFVLAVLLFVLRLEIPCIAAAILCGASVIFLFDMKLAPHLRYRKHLREIHGGLSHRMAGRLISIGEEPHYEDNCWFYEFVLNIYEDLDPEGERLFLLDCKKSLPPEWIGQDVAVTYHGKYVLDCAPLEDVHEAG